MGNIKTSLPLLTVIQLLVLSFAISISGGIIRPHNCPNAGTAKNVVLEVSGLSGGEPFHLQGRRKYEVKYSFTPTVRGKPGVVLLDISAWVWPFGPSYNANVGKAKTASLEPGRRQTILIRAEVPPISKLVGQDGQPEDKVWVPPTTQVSMNILAKDGGGKIVACRSGSVVLQKG